MGLWEGNVPVYGRENIRRFFDEWGEFTDLVNTIIPNGSATSAVSSLLSARVEPINQPGSGLLGRDATWSVSLLSVPGRAGLDLGLGLSYSSMVWTRSGPYIYFDEDNGFPSPGFRLGFPTIQERFFDALVGDNAYVLLSAAGQRVELRQVGATNVYEAADSSYLQLTDNGSSLLVRSTDGAQMNYTKLNNEWRCNQIKDRNGNYITVNYDGLGHITTITDTLGRVVTFNYDGNSNLISITQVWNGQTHQWATFGWGAHTMQSSFSSAAVVGPPNNTVLPVLTTVGLDDGSHYDFQYTNAAQVSFIGRSTFDNVQRSATAFNYPAATGDCPRLDTVNINADKWTGINGVPASVATSFVVPGDGSYSMVGPDGTIYKEFYGTGWQRGLPTSSEVWSGGVRRKWTTTAWDQDNPGVNYHVNPRVTETNVYDDGGNRRRTTIAYTSFGLPSSINEWTGASANVLYRQTNTAYRFDSAYVNRRIIGLVDNVRVIDGATGAVVSKVTYGYDWDFSGDMFQDTPAPAVQHDRNNYGPSLIFGRGNLSEMGRWDADDPENLSKVVETKWRVNSTGSVLMVRDHLWHQSYFAYTDSFSEGGNRNTFAYATTLTDADGFSSFVQYNFDFGAKTRTQSPPPAGQPQGQIQVFTFNAAGQLERITTANNGAYQRFWYGPDYVASLATVNNVADEAYTNQVFDGLGRLTGTANNNPGSAGGYKAQLTQYDLMGRQFKRSNPAEINGYWAPAGDDQAGWLYTAQTYDWKGRPLVTTNTDGTTKEASYSGCGCAGGDVVTLTDEGTVDGGVAKRRQQKIYSDGLGRTVKTEVANWQGGSIYSTTVNTYNVRNQVTVVREFDGTGPGDLSDPSCSSSTCQKSSMTYDGHGRLKTRHVPQQTVGTNTVWEYNADDTVFRVTDARGATCTYGYNNRHQVTTATHSLSGSSPINLSYGYDAVGNRTGMTDGLGHVDYVYDQLSRLLSENRFINGISNPLPSPDGAYKITYGYNLANQLQSITDPFNSTVNHNHDTAGRLSSVTGSAYAGITSYASNVAYRAWGAVKSASFGNSATETIQYNARLQPTEFRLNPGWYGMRENFAYYADGRLKTITDLDDGPGSMPTSTYHYMSRSYTYDHAGRVLFSGGSPHASPYNQFYGYDAFDNLTLRSGAYGYQGTPADPATFSQNRRDGWSYDADGRLTVSPANANTPTARIWTHNAAGQLISTAETIGGTTNTLTSGRDGDGQVVSEALNGVAVDYLLHSTVLGGEVLTKLNASGNKSYTYVPAGGLVFARQTTSSGQPWMEWSHRDPLGVTEGMAAYDPLGNYAPHTTPPQGQAPPTPTGPPWGSFSGGFGTSSNFGTGCVLDGAPAYCSSVMGQGVAAERVNNPSVLSSAISVMGGLTWVPGQDWGTVDLNTATVTIYAGEGHFQRNGDSQVLGDVSVQVRPFLPQDPAVPLSREGVSALIDGIYQMFKDHQGCEEWTNKLLDELKNSTGYTAGTIREILEDFRKSGNVLIYNSDVVGGSAGNWSFTMSSSMPSALVMGEIIHSAGWPSRYPGPDGTGITRGYYSDEAIANAYHKFGVVMSIAQYRNTYPDWVKSTVQQYGYDYTESKLAHGAIDITCMGAVLRLGPQYAKP